MSSFIIIKDKCLLEIINDVIIWYIRYNNYKGDMVMILFVADRIKRLREQSGMTQAELAKRICVSRGTVNAWEMSISAPSCSCLAELSKVFGVSADYLLSLDDGIKIDITDLNEREQEMVMQLVDYFKINKNNPT